MKASMKIPRIALTIMFVANFCCGQTSPILIPEGTKIKVQLEQDLSGDKAQEGQDVQLSVVEDIKIGEIVAIAQGANVTGKVTLAQPKRRLGRTGKIDFSIERVTAVDQTSISLRYTVNKKEGGSHAVSTGVITTGVAIAFFPAAPFVLLRTGKEAKVEKGTIFEVFTDQAHALSIKDDAKNSQIDIVSNPTGADVEINGDFVGNTPISVDLPVGEHEVVLKKKGFLDWSRKFKAIGASVSVNAELEPEIETIPAVFPQAEPVRQSDMAETQAIPLRNGNDDVVKPVEPQKPEPQRGESATVMFENESYTVHIGAIGKNEVGQTSVEMLGDRIGGQIPIRNGNATPPVGMKIVANGQTFEFKSVDISNSRYIFHFDTNASPEKIIVYGNDGSDNSSAVFDGKTKLLDTKPSVPAKASTPPDSASEKVPKTAEADISKTPEPAPSAKPYDARKGVHNIVDLIENKIVEVEIQGDDITSVSVRMRRLVDYPVTVLVPVGSFFVSANPSAQNMVATAESRVTLNGSDWRTISVSAACANRPRDIPDNGDRFTVMRSPQQEELAVLMPVLNKANANTPTRQAAVWIITDDADYDDLGILVSFPGNGRVIDAQTTARAMRICVEAGIDITGKNIWRDRETILHNLPDGDLKRWLQTFSESKAGVR